MFIKRGTHSPFDFFMWPFPGRYQFSATSKLNVAFKWDLKTVKTVNNNRK